MNYLPFDLETALKHPERVVTRDGRKVTELHHFKTTYFGEGNCPLYGVIEGNIHSFTIKGRWAISDDNRDLLLLPKVKECWVNVYYNKWGQLYVEPITFLDEKGAKCLGKDNENLTYIKTIRITNEPE